MEVEGDRGRHRGNHNRLIKRFICMWEAEFKCSVGGGEGNKDCQSACQRQSGVATHEKMPFELASRPQSSQSAAPRQRREIPCVLHYNMLNMECLALPKSASGYGDK